MAAGTRDPRHLGDHPPRVRGVDHGVKRRHDVEGAVRVGQLFELADGELPGREAPAGVLDQGRGGVEAADAHPALGGQLGEQPRPAPSVEQHRPRRRVKALERGLEQRLVLALGPLRPRGRVHAPQVPLDVGRAHQRTVHAREHESTI
jgi:hypothetical protein